MKNTLLFLFSLSFLLLGCVEEISDDINLPAEEITLDFKNAKNSWISGFADLPADSDQTPRSQFELEGNYNNGPVDGAQTFKLSGKNLSSDLFMFLTRKIDQLAPNQTYYATVSVDFYSNVPVGLIGAGGSPGESVYLKAGILDFQPQVYTEVNFDYINVDKGNQSQEGTEMVNLGNITHNAATQDYQLIQRKNSKLIEFKSNANGEAWVILGTESGFMGTTTLYYNEVSITFGTSEF
ncbi:MAG: hypothetical protein AAF705_11150 [Bacteroidota bacterium]